MLNIKNYAKENRQIEISISATANTPLKSVSQSIEYDNQQNTITRNITIDGQLMLTQNVLRDEYGNTSQTTNSGYINSTTRYLRDIDDYNISTVVDIIS